MPRRLSLPTRPMTLGGSAFGSSNTAGGPEAVAVAPKGRSSANLKTGDWGVAEIGAGD